MTIPPIDVSPQHWQIVQDILRKHVPTQQVWAFGSRAKRTARRYSDLDLAIITDQPLPFEVSGAIAEDFSESDLPFRVDILDWATTSDSFRRIVEADKVVLQPHGPIPLTPPFGNRSENGSSARPFQEIGAETGSRCR